MEKIKLIYKEIIGLVVCGLIYFLEARGIIELGKIYNQYFPCKEKFPPVTSFACYSWVDFVVILYVLPALAIVLVGIILFKLKKEK